MRNKRIRLPPLNALKPFHAAARQGSIRGAANELLVTPQAVGQQIKLLEDILQVTLFERKGRSIEPTEAAIVLSRFVDTGFEEFAEGVRRITKQTYKDRITLNVSPYFATRYLLPRLAHFRETVPNSDLRMTTMVETPDFARDDIDVAVQWGYGEWTDLEVTLLLKDDKIICCVEEVAKRIKKPEDILQETLLHPVLKNTLWRDILRFLNLPEPENNSEIAFHDAATMRRATLSGMGIGLISHVDAEQDIRTGELVAPLGFDAISNMPDAAVPGFYLVLPKSHRRVSGIASFCDWVSRENWRRLGSGT